MTSSKLTPEELEAKVELLERYPGSLDDYNRLKGEEHIQMHIRRSHQLVQVDRNGSYNIQWDLLHQLINDGCIGVIYYVATIANTSYPFGGYGVPVKKAPEIIVAVAVK